MIPEADRQATRRFYDRISRAYDLMADASERTAREKGLELLAVGPGERVLEIGFGTGHALAALARAAGEAGRVVGVDISPGMADVAGHHLERAGLAERVELLVEAVPPIPCGDGELDAVFMSFTLELFPAEVIPPVLAEVRRVLAPRGRLGVVAMTESRSGEGLLERAYKWMHEHFPHIVDCRPIDVEGVLEAAGFHVSAKEVIEIWTLPVTAAVARLP